MAAMRAVDGVPFFEGQDRTYGATLLADARMNRAVYEAVGGKLQQVLLETAHEHQLAPHACEQFRRRQRPSPPRSHQLGTMQQPGRAQRIRARFDLS